MLADSVIESSSTTGTGTYTLVGAVLGGRTFAQDFANAADVVYFVSNLDKTKWEQVKGVLAHGPPRTLTRATILKSSNAGAAIDWLVTDSYYVFSIASADALAGLTRGSLASATRPWWIGTGGSWLDYTLGLGVAWIRKRWTGTVDIEEGRHDIANGIFTPSPRNTWLDIGAAGVAMAATHVGKVLLFDTTAGARTLTLLAGATAGIGHGFTCWVLGYGGTAGVVLDPAGSEIIDAGSAGANLTVPPNTLTRLSWDGAKGQWRTDLMSTANFPAGTVVQRVYAEYTDATNLTAAIPGDDSIPQVGEGAQIFSQIITPLRAANRIRVRVLIWGQVADASQYGIAALFRNGAANALRAAAGMQSQQINDLKLEYEDSPASVSAQTYSVQVGASSGNMRLNGTSAARLFGGASACTMVLEEIQQ